MESKDSQDLLRVSLLSKEEKKIISYVRVKQKLAILEFSPYLRRP